MALPQPNNITDITPKVKLMDSRPVLIVDPELASAIGLDEAVFVGQLLYWMQRSENVHDEKTWVYNTVDGWLTQFPFWKRSALYRTITSCVEKGVILIGEFNAKPTDRTKWYTVNPDFVFGICERTLIPKTEYGDSENGTGSFRKRNMHIPKTESVYKEQEITTEITTEKSTPLPPKPKNISRSKPMTTIPDDFGISDRLEKWASAKGFTLADMESQIERFRNNAAMKQHRYADWDAAFQNWMHNARDWGHLHPLAPASTSTSGPPLRTKNGGYTAEGLAQLAREQEARGE